MFNNICFGRHLHPHFTVASSQAAEVARPESPVAEVLKAKQAGPGRGGVARNAEESVGKFPLILSKVFLFKLTIVLPFGHQTWQ
jgi:hypothetical protein